ncbi:MAG: efflux RND transporter periplasmic adaptor subunit [Pseudomonadota bacterium]
MRPIVFASALAAALAPMTAAAQDAAAPPAPAVVAEPAEMASLVRAIEFTGRVVALQQVDLRARVSGFLEAKEFQEGVAVAAGDVLFRVERGLYEAAVEEIGGQIAAAEAELTLATIERDRQATLVERGSVAQSQLDVAVAELGRTAGAVQQLKGSLQRAELELSYTVISAPFDGLVGLSQWDVGAFVGPDSGSLVSLVRQDPMTVEFPIPAPWAFRIRSQAGDDASAVTARIRLPDGEIYDQDGAIDFIDVQVAGGTDTITLRATFANPDNVLIHGALVGVLISEDAPELELAVPQQAIQQDLQGAFVMIVDADSNAQQRRVVVDRYTEGRAVIESGLEEGEIVIVEGITKARPGRPVNAAPPAAAAQDG